MAQDRFVRRRRALLALAACASVVPLAPAAASTDAPPFRFGVHRFTVADLDDPVAAIFRADGALVVAEAGSGRLVLVRGDGDAAERTVLGGAPLLRPAGLAAAADGRLLVTDAVRARVEVFGADGAHLGGWGGFGAEPGRFDEPRGIAVRGDVVAVADAGNRRVQIFGLDGTVRGAVGPALGADGPLVRPTDVAFVDDDTLAVTDADDDRIRLVALDGAPRAAVGGWGPFDGLFDEPAGLAVHGGELVVCDRRNHRIQHFAPDGAFRAAWGRHAILLREGEGKLHYPDALAIAADGARGAIVERLEDRIQVFAVFDPAAPPAPLGPAVPPKQPHFGERVDVEGDLLLVLEPEGHKGIVFETLGSIPIVIGDFGERGRTPGLFLRPEAIALDLARQRLLVADPVTRRLDRYALHHDPAEPRGYQADRVRFAGALDLAVVGRAGGLERPPEPSVLRRAPGAALAMLDRRNRAVLVLDASTLEPRLRFGGYGAGDGRFLEPSDFVVTDDGDFLVLDAARRDVQRFGPDGAFRARLDGGGVLRRPRGLALLPDGDLLVSDAGANRIVRLDASGAPVLAFGARGIGHAELWKPAGLAVDRKGRVFVVDHGNHRMQIFEPDGTWTATFGTGRAYDRRNAEPSSAAAPTKEIRP